MPVTLGGPRDLTREAVEAVAWDGRRLAVSPAALERVAEGQAELAALLAGGARVYGVNTGMGWLASVDLDAAAQEVHQRNLLLGRAVGGPPWLEAAEVRALLVARLANLVSGHAGVGPELVRFLVDRVNDGFGPAVPRSPSGARSPTGSGPRRGSRCSPGRRRPPPWPWPGCGPASGWPASC